MFENVVYKANNNEYILNGDSPDYLTEFSHKVLFSIENKTINTTFSYNIGISHPLWAGFWKIDSSNAEQIEKVKNIYLEKAKRLIDAQKEEYTDITLTPLNMPKDLDEAINSLTA